MKRKKVLTNLMLIGFIGYCFILTFERLLAIIISPFKLYPQIGEQYAFNSGNPMTIVFYIITCLSVILGAGALWRPMYHAFKALFTKEKYDFSIHYNFIILGSMVLLVSGMMHTGFTSLELQFTAYSFLIMSMVCKCIDFCMDNKKDLARCIVSVVYLVLFSMSIGVCYLSYQNSPIKELFYVSELLGVFVLIPCFGYLLFTYFKTGLAKTSILFPILVLVLDGLIIALGWKQEVNYFLLIFASLCLVSYIVYIIFNKVKENGN